MSEEKYITPNYETISTIEKRNLIEITQSSLINALSPQDYTDILNIYSRVIERLNNK